MLTAEQLKERAGKLTASSIGLLIRGSEEDILNLWRGASGDPSYQEPDFSNNWPVQLGVATETLNMDWFAKKHGPVSRRGEVVTHANGWAAATLDGWSDDHQCPIEGKHVIQYKKLSDVLDWYAPQFHWQMFVTGAKQMRASIIIGSLEPQVEAITYDEGYGASIIERATAFMACVQNMIPPVVQAPIAAPVRREEWRTVDMAGNNLFADAAADWLENKESATKFDVAKEGIKACIEPDVGVAFGYGIIVKRSKNGALSIKEGKE